MIRLKFSGFQDAHDIILSAAGGFRVAGNFLRKLPENEVVGEYSRHQWHVQGGHFSRYDVLDPCYLHFADFEGAASEKFGPFTSVHAADGTMYTTELFAKFIDESLLWHSFELENYWPNLIIRP